MFLAGRLAAAPALVAGGWAGLSTTYLLAMLAAAGRGEPPSDLPGSSASRPLPRLLVLVPAHDEEPVIAAAVGSLLAADYPPERRRVVVVADNCSDATAAVARAHGAEAWERSDRDRPGKGQALAWALRRAAPPEHDAVVMVDADCVASQNLLLALGEQLAAGADAVQARYTASNPAAAPAAGLRYAGFALVNTVRPMAKSRLRLSAGLLGTGMAFPNRTLELVPWNAFSVTEDREYHLRLLEAGLSVRFAETTSVASAMPETAAGGAAQQVRWDTGNALLARRFVPRLLGRAVRGGSLDALHAAIELLVPPQTLLAGMGIATIGVAATLRARRLAALGGYALSGQAAYVLGGLRLTGAPPAVFRALAHSPGLIARRVAQDLAIFTGRGALGWVRTERAGPAQRRASAGRVRPPAGTWLGVSFTPGSPST